MAASTKKKVNTKKSALKKSSVKKSSTAKKAADKTIKTSRTKTKKNKAADDKANHKTVDQKEFKMSEGDESASDQVANNVFVLNPNLAINGAADFHKTLTELSEMGENVIFDASALEMIDTASFQLLLAFVFTINGAGLSLSWLNPSDVLLERADILGLTEALCLKELA